MILNIIEPNFIFKHKYFSFYKVIGLFYFYFLLKYTGFNSDDSFLVYVEEIKIISITFLGLSIILFFINSFLYSKEGKIIISKESIQLSRDGWKKTIDLNKINSIKIEKLTGKEYILKINTLKINLEINQTELEALKKLETVTEIKFDKISIFSRLINSLKIFANKNKSFMKQTYSK